MLTHLFVPDLFANKLLTCVYMLCVYSELRKIKNHLRKSCLVCSLAVCDWVQAPPPCSTRRCLCFSGVLTRSPSRSTSGTVRRWRTLWTMPPRRSAASLVVSSHFTMCTPHWPHVAAVPPTGAPGEVRLPGELQPGGRPAGHLHRVLPVRHAGAGLGLPAPLPRVQTRASLLRRLISFTA